MIRSVVRLLTPFLFGAAAATPLFATTYTSSQSGNWSSSSTWGGMGVPSAGDTANVPHTVTLDPHRCPSGRAPAVCGRIGVSPALFNPLDRAHRRESAGRAHRKEVAGVPSAHEVG